MKCAGRHVVFVYLCFAIDSCMVLQQEVCHLCVAIVTSHVQWSVTHLSELKMKEETQR